MQYLASPCPPFPPRSLREPEPARQGENCDSPAGAFGGAASRWRGRVALRLELENPPSEVTNERLEEDGATAVRMTELMLVGAGRLIALARA